MLKRTLAIALALCCVSAAGCIAIRPKADGGTQVSVVLPGQTPSEASSGSVTVVGQPQKPKVKGAYQGGLAHVGQSLTTGIWKAQVDSVQHLQSLPDDSKPAAGKEFFVVNVNITNLGTSAALVVRPDQFELSDVKGTLIAPYPTKLSAFNANQVKPVEVGTGGYTKFVYELAPNTTDLRFIVTPNQAGAPGSMAWAVP